MYLVVGREVEHQIIQSAVWAPIGERDRERDREWREWRDRSWEREGARRGRGRQLPPTPTKPSTLQVKQQPPFTRISHSPSHVSTFTNHFKKKTYLSFYILEVLQIIVDKSRLKIFLQLSLRHTVREPLEPQHDEYEYGREVERLIHRDYRSRER